MILFLQASYIRLSRAKHTLATVLCLVMFNMAAIVSWDIYSTNTIREINHDDIRYTYRPNGINQRLTIEGQHMYSGSHHNQLPVIPRETLWPHSIYGNHDRILNQLRFKSDQSSLTNKTILFYFGLDAVRRGNEPFRSQSCKMSSCYLIDNLTQLYNADAIIFQNKVPDDSFLDTFNRPSGQIWIWFALESPVHSVPVHRFR